ncbi:CBP80/20-dependent translation initiation factor-like [Glandiceps talaboti]
MAASGDNDMLASLRVRGRGRGIRPAQDGLTGPLRRPNINGQVGQSISTLEEITNRMKQVDMATVEEDATQVMNMVQNYADTGKQLQDVGDSLCRLALDNFSFGLEAAQLCNRLANIEVEGVKFRNIILKLLQAEFGRRENLKNDAINTWLGLVTFLVELFVVMRTQNGEILKALAKPVFVCVTELLGNSTEEEVEHCIHELKRRGGFLQEQDNCSMEKVLLSVRDRLLDPDTSTFVRCLLLEVLEMSANGWTLNDGIKAYYKEIISRY